MATGSVQGFLVQPWSKVLKMPELKGCLNGSQSSSLSQPTAGESAWTVYSAVQAPAV